MFKKHWKLISLMVYTGLALCIGTMASKQILEKEQDVSLEQVPKAVIATILKEAVGAKIEEVVKEIEDDDDN